jgi:hypothetical protein
MAYGINAPFGLVPFSYFGSTGWNGGFQEMPFLATTANSMYRGDLVTYAAGVLVQYIAGTTPTGTAGVFIGCRYQDTNGIWQFSKYWPQGTAVAAGTQPIAQVITDPNTIFTIQSAGTLIVTNVDFNCEISGAGNPYAGNTATGLSVMSLSVTPATTATLPLRIIGVDPTPGNAFGVQFNNALVVINTSAFKAGTLGV